MELCTGPASGTQSDLIRSDWGAEHNETSRSDCVPLPAPRCWDCTAVRNYQTEPISSVTAEIVALLAFL